MKNGYLFKDILNLENVKNSSKLGEILKLLAFQIGNQVSINEIANKVGLSKSTVERYIDLFEKSFIIKKIGSFSRNLRNEITKSSKYFFWDNGVRNALINNFNKISDIDDIGKLWENYIVMEFLKKQGYQKIFSSNYFWRTYEKKEIDFIEERGGKLYGFEIKWDNKKVKEPKLWLETYKNASLQVVTKENFLTFF